MAVYEKQMEIIVDEDVPASQKVVSGGARMQASLESDDKIYFLLSKV